MSNFIEMVPLRSSSSRRSGSISRISVSFSKNRKDKYFLVIYIGREIAEQLALLSDSSKIKFFIDDENPYQWLIKKSDDNFGYSLVHCNKKYLNIVRAQIVWKGAAISLKKGAQIVSHEITPEGILIDTSALRQENS